MRLTKKTNDYVTNGQLYTRVCAKPYTTGISKQTTSNLCAWQAKEFISDEMQL